MRPPLVCICRSNLDLELVPPSERERGADPGLICRWQSNAAKTCAAPPTKPTSLTSPSFFAQQLLTDIRRRLDSSNEDLVCERPLCWIHRATPQSYCKGNFSHALPGFCEIRSAARSPNEFGLARPAAEAALGRPLPLHYSGDTDIRFQPRDVSNLEIVSM